MDEQVRRRLLYALNRALAGAELCRNREQAAHDSAPRLPGAGLEIIDLRGHDAHDVDYYAWEAVRIDDIARTVTKVVGSDRIDELRSRLAESAPALREFRNATTHVNEPDDRLEGVIYFGQAVRALAGGGVEYLVDPRYDTHDALRNLASGVKDALLELAQADQV